MTGDQGGEGGLVAADAVQGKELLVGPRVGRVAGEGTG
jgi:hypothetical protein